jgi:uncharacterized peroxidase-related enzyme
LYYDALVEESPLARPELEMVVVATSGAKDCLYCVVAHGVLLRIYAEDPTLAEQLATNYRTANIGDAHRAMCGFGVKVTNSLAEVTDKYLERLREHGFSDTEIWDIASTPALSTSRTGWPMSPICDRTRSSTRWGGVELTDPGAPDRPIRTLRRE